MEAFALFNVFYQAGILAGPLVGLAMTAVDFRITAGAAALIFAVLTVAQWCALPTGPARTGHTSVLRDWRTVLGNRRFTAFVVVMTGSYVLSFQVYLALPLHARGIHRRAVIDGPVPPARGRGNRTASVSPAAGRASGRSRPAGRR